MWGYGMMGYGGWMFFWWIGGLFIIGAVIYAAVRFRTHHAHRDDYGYYDCSSHSRDCRDDRHYYDRDGRYRRDDDRCRSDER